MIRKILYWVKIIVLTFIFWTFVSATVENIVIRNEVHQFKKQGVYQEDISTKKVKYYAVYDENESEKAFTEKNGTLYPGVRGDITLALQSAFPDTLIDPFVTFLFGGHAAMSVSSYEDQNMYIEEKQYLEATGLGNDNVAVSSNGDYWNSNDYKNEVIGIRVNCTKKEKEIAFNHAVSYLGDPYNYSFIFNTNKTKYCTDLISEAYLEVGVDLNKDMVGVTVQDLVVSNRTYLYYYKHFDSDDVTHIYYRTNYENRLK